MAKIDTEPATIEAVPENDELLVKAANMNIKRFVPQEKPGIYDDQVHTLLEVDAATGYPNSIEVLVPADEVKKHKRYFVQAARKVDRTARIVNGEEGVSQGDNGRLLEFVLVPKVHRKKAETTSEDTPEAVPSA